MNNIHLFELISVLIQLFSEGLGGLLENTGEQTFWKPRNTVDKTVVKFKKALGYKQYESKTDW